MDLRLQQVAVKPAPRTMSLVGNFPSSGGAEFTEKSPVFRELRYAGRLLVGDYVRLWLIETSRVVLCFGRAAQEQSVLRHQQSIPIATKR